MHTRNLTHPPYLTVAALVDGDGETGVSLLVSGGIVDINSGNLNVRSSASSSSTSVAQYYKGET